MKIIQFILSILIVAEIIALTPVLLAFATLKTVWSFCKGGFERLDREQRGF